MIILLKECAKINPSFNFKRMINHCAFLNRIAPSVKYADLSISLDTSHIPRAGVRYSIYAAFRTYGFILFAEHFLMLFQILIILFFLYILPSISSRLRPVLNSTGTLLSSHISIIE